MFILALMLAATTPAADDNKTLKTDFEKNIVGKAFFVWMNFGNLKRIGGFE